MENPWILNLLGRLIQEEDSEEEDLTTEEIIEDQSQGLIQDQSLLLGKILNVI